MKTRDKGSAQRAPRTGTNADAGRSDTQDILLTAASDLMIAKDSVDFSLAEVALKTGMSAALVQYHFGSKEGLLMAIVERGASKAVEQLAALDTMDLTAEQKLRMHVGGMIAAYSRAPYINRLLNLLMQNSNDERALRISEIFIKPIADFHRALIEQGVREGAFRWVDPLHFYFVLVGACDHIVARRCALRHVFDTPELTDDLRRAYTETVYEIVRAGIAAQAKSPARNPSG